MCSLRVGCGSRACVSSPGSAANNSATPSAAADSKYFIGSPPHEGDASQPIGNVPCGRCRVEHSEQGLTIGALEWFGGCGGPAARTPHQNHDHDITDKPHKVAGRVRPKVGEERHMT